MGGMGLGFRLRRRVPLAPPVWKLRRASLERWLAARPPAVRRRAEALAARYDLSRWPQACWPHEIGESLHLLDLCDRHLVGRVPPGRGLDVGSKNWAYLPALAAAFPHGWDGIELDAQRRYLTLHTRASVARWRARHFPGCRYRAGSVLELAGSWALVTWILPFLTPEALRACGLPAAELRPLELLRHVHGLLVPGGLLFVVNQGAREAALQRALFEEAGIAAEPLGQLDATLSPYRQPRHGWLVRRAAQAGGAGSQSISDGVCFSV